MEITYNSFIQNILNTRGRFNCEGYHERHHIVPRCKGGTNDENNLIDLYAKEHFIAHELLYRENKTDHQLAYAYFCMAFVTKDSTERYKLTADEYENVRKECSEIQKSYLSNKENHPNFGKHLSEETRRKIGFANKGTTACVGRVISKETREKIGLANSNISDETKAKMSVSQKRRGHWKGNNNPNKGGANTSGGKNGKAKKLIRKSDGKIYDCIKEAAIDNGIKERTLYSQLRNHRKCDFELLDA